MIERSSVALIGGMGSGKSTIADRMRVEFGFRKRALATHLKAIAEVFLGRAVDKNTDRHLLQRLNAGRQSDFSFMTECLRKDEAEQRAGVLRLASYLVAANHLDFFPNWAEFDAAVDRLASWLYSMSTTGRSPIDGFGRADYYVSKLRNALLAEGALLVRDVGQVEANPSKPIVVDDVRRVDEAMALVEWGFVLVKVDTPLEVRIQRIRERDGHFDPAWLEHESEREIDMIRCSHFVPGVGDLKVNVAQLVRRLPSPIGRGV